MSIASDDKDFQSQCLYYRFSPTLPPELDGNNDNNNNNNASLKASKSTKIIAWSSCSKSNTKTKMKAVTPPPDDQDEDMDAGNAVQKKTKPKKPTTPGGRPAPSNTRTTRSKVKVMANTPPQDNDDNMEVDEGIELEAPMKATKLKGRAAITAACARVSVETSTTTGGKCKGAPSLPDTPRKPSVGKKSKTAPPLAPPAESEEETAKDQEKDWDWTGKD
ncbi:hypothetical protein TRAPUB_10791 [Trametes pubescens]|uniref:Uncharacterized protein n=1 Tax=Trametes pubescens TaxID=154538 RepID=A0A1M2VYK9_TRAPU|nr:hypothetical protein TRAPUB_10791 [Trametes pubescens]